MSKIKDGGSAFPGIRIVERDNYHPNIKVYYKGMTLRDWFAGQALNEMVSGWSNYEKLAKDCYEIADAMLAEREKQPKEG